MCKQQISNDPNQTWTTATRFNSLKSFLLLTMSVHGVLGVKGVVLDENDDPIEGAHVGILNRDWMSQTRGLGQFFRLLLPGTYYLHVSITTS